MSKQRIVLFIPVVIFMLLSVLLWRGLSNDPTNLPSALLNKPVPVFNLPVLAAEENPAGIISATNEIFKGHVTLLNVWATWCVTCKQEHDYLMTLKEQGVRIIGVNYKDNIEGAEKWLKDLLNPYYLSVVDKNGRLGLDLGVYGAPETFIIDKQAIIRYRYAGEVNEEVWLETLKPIVESLR